MSKGITTGTLAAILIGLAVAIVIFVFVGRWYATLQAYTPKAQCRGSVEKHILTGIGGIEQFRTEIVCPPQEILLDQDLDSEAGRQEALAQLAALMADAWWVFHEGKAELFAGEGLYCAIYAWIDFAEKGKSLTGLIGYMRDTKLPGRDISYMDYLSGYVTPQASAYVDDYARLAGIERFDDAIDSSQSWAVLFVYAKGKDFISKAIEDWAGGRAKAALLSGLFSYAGGVTVGLYLFGTAAMPYVGVASLVLAGVAFYESFTAGRQPEWLASVMLRPWNRAEIEALGCTELPVRMTEA
mgnify:CR=1 FL=1